MSVHVESWAWKQQAGSPLRKLILVKLAQNADDDGWSWWRQTRMARECETSRSTVQQHLKALRGMGLIAVHSADREDGGRAANAYRVLVPWADEADEPPARKQGGGAPGNKAGGARQTGGPPARETGTMNSQIEEPSEEPSQNLAADAAPEFLGQRRWKVKSSRPEKGWFVVDLATNRCACENRSSTPCRHVREATAAEARMDTARRRELRDAVWDALVGIFGAPTQRQNADRGLVVTEIAELIAGEGIEQTPERWTEEVSGRYNALAREWGVGKATLHALLNNWSVAGKLLSGVRADSNNVPDERFDRFTRD